MTAGGEGGARDLRTGAHADLGVSVERDLTGSGRLARGGSTRFSSLRFRSVGLPAPAEEAETAEDRARPAPAPPAAPAVAEPGPRPPLARRLLRWLGLG